MRWSSAIETPVIPEELCLRHELYLPRTSKFRVNNNTQISKPHPAQKMHTFHLSAQSAVEICWATHNNQYSLYTPHLDTNASQYRAFKSLIFCCSKISRLRFFLYDWFCQSPFTNNVTPRDFSPWAEVMTHEAIPLHRRSLKQNPPGPVWRCLAA